MTPDDETRGRLPADLTGIFEDAAAFAAEGRARSLPPDRFHIILQDLRRLAGEAQRHLDALTRSP